MSRTDIPGRYLLFKTVNANVDEAQHWLAAHDIRLTAMRLLVARVFLGAGRPLSVLEVDSLLDTADRSTITRTLQLFLDRGAVHAIDDGSGSTRYEVCRGNHDSGLDDDEHPHFHCRGCGRTFCIDTMTVPACRLPEGYRPEHVNYVITGLCPACSGR